MTSMEGIVFSITLVFMYIFFQFYYKTYTIFENVDITKEEFP